MNKTVDITVLAVGNPIMADDGLGPKMLELLCEAFDLQSPVSTVVNPVLDSIDAPMIVHEIRSRSSSFAPQFRQALLDGSLVIHDGGAAGMELVALIQDTKRLLILDALAPITETIAGQNITTSPGSALHLSGDQIPRMLSSKLSPHQVSLLDVLTACRLLGSEPEQVDVVGVVSENLELNVGLSPAVQTGIAPALQMVTEVLRKWLQ